MEREITLPIIDVKRAVGARERQELGDQLVKSLETVGFLYVDNAPGLDFETLHKNCQKFFALSSAAKWKVTKHTWNKNNSNRYRGYFPLQPDEVSYKEGFEIGLERSGVKDVDVHPLFREPNLWPPFIDGLEEFKQQMVSYYNSMVETGTEVFRLLALGSGLDEYWFESMFLPDTLSTLRLLHYPQRPDQPPQIAVDGNSVLCCSEHSDSGFVTLLSTFHYSGLQIRTPDNKWMDVTPRPNSLVMNIGDILSKLSNGRFKATRHRVVDTLQDRFSVPFFFEPRYSANINRPIPFKHPQLSGGLSPPCTFASNGEIKYGPWLIEKMQQFAEYKDILEV